jgi:tetratricopeptide (TPR) repeat protein
MRHQNLPSKTSRFAKENNWVNSISRCHRVLGAISRKKKEYKEAEEHLNTSLEIAKRVGMPALEIETLIEYGRLYLEKDDHKSAIDTADQILRLCERTGFKLYEPDAELILAKAYSKDTQKSKHYAESAHQKAKGMGYHSSALEAIHLFS